MNRAERRKAGIKKKEPTYVLTKSQIDQIKIECTNEALDKAFVIMMGLPVMVIHDHFKDLWKKEEKSREERFSELLLDLYDSVERDFISFQDILDCLEDECGLKFEQLKKRK